MVMLVMKTVFLVAGCLIREVETQVYLNGEESK